MHGAPGAAHRRFGVGINQIGHGFGLRQIELLVQIGALCEFTGLGHAQMRQPRRVVGLEGLRQRQATRHHHVHDDGAAVALQLQHVFAGVTVRAGKVNGQYLVDGLTLRILECEQVRMARRERLLTQGFGEGFQMLATDAHHAHRTAARRRGDGHDRVVTKRQHV